VKDTRLLSIHSLSQDELCHHLVEAGFESYRGKQVYQFLYHHEINSFQDMKNLPRKLIEYLEGHFILKALSLLDTRVSGKKDCYKYLFELADKRKVESVVIKDRSRKTLCLSSQVGCSLNCVFCATGQLENQRNLSPGEMVSQFLYAREKHGSIDNLVFMGMGEPLLNYKNLIKTIRILNSKEGVNFGMKRITISTAGITRSIRRLADEKMNLHLAVSLNSPDTKTRLELMPFSKKIPLKDLLGALRYYQEKTGDRITLEYVMLKNVNMSRQDAKAIINLTKELRFNLNLIPYNPVPELGYESPDHEDIDRFMRFFQYSRLEIVLRRRKGEDIGAACGQLAASDK